MSRFFIDRPIFAWVIALVIMLAGAIAITHLPIARYPAIAPPAIGIKATYPGASAQVVDSSVTQVIEQNLKGLDGLLYIAANSSSNGQSNITLTFASGTDPDIAQVQVQNKLQLATPMLPQAVQQQGLSVVKTNESPLMVLGFLSTDDSMSMDEIGDYVATNVIDELSRISGVGEARLFGAKYAMRIWLDPAKLDAYKLSVSEVVSAIQAQNQQLAIGELGGTPAISGQELTATINTRGRLQSPEEFRQIVLRGNADGSLVTLEQVARVEIGTEHYNTVSRINGVPATSTMVTLATDANALLTARELKERLSQLEENFPAGMTSTIAFDTTPFVAEAIKGVIMTLVEAIVLVFLVMYLFLQNLRATLIPTIAVPVVLLGTFAVLQVFGYSINMLTMFAMVLAIGLLVDDAIVVVENVERLMSEEGLSPLEATRKSMDQITGALVAIGVVLSAVFVPMAFLGGSTGVIYRQFSVTIVAAMALSVLVALILTPALCATLLKPTAGHRPQGGFFGWFNRIFDRSSRGYQGAVANMISRRKRFLGVFALMVVAVVYLFMRLPTAFLPDEDQGRLMGMVQAPVGATQERTGAVIRQVEDYFLKEATEGVELLHVVQGFSFGGSGQNMGGAFITLNDWSERTGEGLSAAEIASKATRALSRIQDGMAFVFAPPPVPELGTATGFTFYLTDGGGLGHAALLEARNQLLQVAATNPRLAKVRPNGVEDGPQLRVDIDYRKAAALGLSTSDINTTLATAWGGRYIDDFVDRGRVKRVYVQADAPYRMVPDDFNRWSVRNAAGEMVRFPAFASARWDYGSPRLERYNGLPALQINGEAAPGVSTGTAMKEIEQLATQLPAGIGVQWTGSSFLERAAGAQLPLMYILSLLVVFLCLAALYESWTIPTAVMLAAPLGILGALLANTLRGMERDIYFQVAMLATVGLSSKNAILIVEFAKANLEQGMALAEATMAAVRDRLRPIIMTSLAFGLGVLPLATATGAGSGAQQAIGTGVLGGMIVGTLLGIFFVPLFFVVVQKLFGKPVKTAEAPAAVLTEEQAHG